MMHNKDVHRWEKYGLDAVDGAMIIGKAFFMKMLTLDIT